MGVVERKLDLAISVESALADVYGLLSGDSEHNPGLLKYLSRVERSHAAFLAIVATYFRRGELGRLDVIDVSEDELKAALWSALALKAGIERREVSLEAVLREALSLEERTCSRFLSSLEEREKDSAALRRLLPIIFDIDEHVKALKEALGKSDG